MGFKLDLGDLVVYIRAETASFTSGIKKAESLISNAQRNISSAATKMSLAFTVPITAMAVTSVKAFSDFDQAMTESTAIMGEMSSKMRTGLEDTARVIATSSIKSATELAASYFFLASAGFSAAQSLETLQHVERFAVAGAFDMKKATDLLTDAQSALGLTVDNTAKNTENLIHVSDVLVKANTLANATVAQFSRSLTSKAGASLRILNKDMEEGVAILAAFADQGIKAELAGERLAIVIRDIQTSALGKRGKPPWEEFGLSAWDAAGKMKPLVEIITDLEDHLEGMSDKARKARLLLLGFQDRSINAIMSLIGVTDQIKRYEKELRKAGGTTKKVYDKQLKSFASKLKIVRNKVADVAIGIGRMLSPALEWLMKQVEMAVDWWNKLTETQKREKLSLLALAAAIGPVTKALSAFITVVTSIGALGFVIAGAVAELLGIGGLKDAWERTQRSAGSFSEGVIAFFKDYKKHVADAVEKMSSWVSAFTDIGKRMSPILSALIDQVMSLVDWWKGLTDEQKDQNLSIGAWVFAVGGAVSVFTTLVDVVGGVGLGIAAATAAIVGPGGLKDAWEKITGFSEGLGDKVEGFFTNFRENMGILFTWIKKNWGTLIFNMIKVVGRLIILVLETVQPIVVLMFTNLVAAVKQIGDMAVKTAELIKARLNPFTRDTTIIKLETELLDMGDFSNALQSNITDAFNAALKNVKGLTLESFGFVDFTSLDFNTLTKDQKESTDAMAEILTQFRIHGREDRAIALAKIVDASGTFSQEMIDRVLQIVEAEGIAREETATKIQDTWSAWQAKEHNVTKEAMQTILNNSVKTTGSMLESMKKVEAALVRRAETLDLRERRASLRDIHIQQDAHPIPGPGERAQDNTPVHLEIVNTMSPELISRAALSTKSSKMTILNILGENIGRGGVMRKTIIAGGR